MGAGEMLIRLKCALIMTMIAFVDGVYSAARIGWTTWQLLFLATAYSLL